MDAAFFVGFIGFWWIVVALLLDYTKQRIIRFRVLGERYWQIAFDQNHLIAKLDGRMAEVCMPASPIVVRLWRKVCPLRGIEMN